MMADFQSDSPFIRVHWCPFVTNFLKREILGFWLWCIFPDTYTLNLGSIYGLEFEAIGV